MVLTIAILLHNTQACNKEVSVILFAILQEILLCQLISHTKTNMQVETCMYFWEGLEDSLRDKYSLRNKRRCKPKKITPVFIITYHFVLDVKPKAEL